LVYRSNEGTQPIADDASMPVPPNKTKLTGPPPPTLARMKARAGGSG